MFRESRTVDPAPRTRSSRFRGHTAMVVEPTDELDDDLRLKLARLDDELDRLERVVVAFSGGADSAFLTAYAARTLGHDHVHAVTAVSPSLAGDEQADCRELAAEW